jgi:hypothetical protein
MSSSINTEAPSTPKLKNHPGLGAALGMELVIDFIKDPAGTMERTNKQFSKLPKRPSIYEAQARGMADLLDKLFPSGKGDGAREASRGAKHVGGAHRAS